MAKIGDVGTLRELDVKPGAVVEYIGEPEKGYNGGARYTITGKSHGEYSYEGQRKGYTIRHYDPVWKLISRANQPTLWRDMTPEEKGALLLAAHEGKVIEAYGVNCDWTGKNLSEWSVCNPIWVDNMAYRVRPELKRETVTLYGGSKEYGCLVVYNTMKIGTETHRITFDTIDGVPDCNSVKMEAI